MSVRFDPKVSASFPQQEPPKRPSSITSRIIGMVDKLTKVILNVSNVEENCRKNWVRDTGKPPCEVTKIYMDACIDKWWRKTDEEFSQRNL